MRQFLDLFFFPDAHAYIEGLTDAERGIVARSIRAITRGELSSVYTKQLEGPVRELIFGPHRITYFTIDAVVYFVRGFRKKTPKAPRREIEYASKMYKILKSKNVS